MKLNILEEIYKKRYELGIIDNNTLNVLLTKNVINKEFYNYLTKDIIRGDNNNKNK